MMSAEYGFDFLSALALFAYIACLSVIVLNQNFTGAFTTNPDSDFLGGCLYRRVCTACSTFSILIVC